MILDREGIRGARYGMLKFLEFAAGNFPLSRPDPQLAAHMAMFVPSALRT